MCIMEHFKVLEYSRIFSNPEYQILFWNHLLGLKRADRAEVYNAEQQSYDLLICSLHHYTVLSDC